MARAQHSGRAYRGFFWVLERVGVREARSRWERKSPFLQRALPPLLIGFIQDYNEGLSWHAPGSAWTNTIVFGILILILVFRPQGRLGEQTPEGS